MRLEDVWVAAADRRRRRCSRRLGRRWSTSGARGVTGIRGRMRKRQATTIPILSQRRHDERHVTGDGGSMEGGGAAHRLDREWPTGRA
jgi:hypothetical protein